MGWPRGGGRRGGGGSRRIPLRNKADQYGLQPGRFKSLSTKPVPHKLVPHGQRGEGAAELGAEESWKEKPGKGWGSQKASAVAGRLAGARATGLGAKTQQQATPCATCSRRLTLVRLGGGTCSHTASGLGPHPATY